MQVRDSIDDRLDMIKTRKQCQIDDFTKLGRRDLLSLFGRVEEDENGKVVVHAYSDEEESVEEVEEVGSEVEEEV